MPKYSAEASLYKRSTYSGREDEQTTEADVRSIIPAQTFDASVPNLADSLSDQKELQYGCVKLPKYCLIEYHTGGDPFPHLLKVPCGYSQYCW
jgi:hypothetical protein